MSAPADEPDDDDGKEECHPEDYEAWTMKQIRKELKERGVDTASECRGCNEKMCILGAICHLIGSLWLIIWYVTTMAAIEEARAVPRRLRHER